MLMNYVFHFGQFEQGTYENNRVEMGDRKKSLIDSTFL